MEASDAPDRSSIGLCFSGGGFRASFYALGIMRYLAEARLLDRVSAISAISGGSIAAAAAADRWTEFQTAGGGVEAFLEKIDGPFRSTVTSKNITRRWLIASLAGVIPGTGGRGGAYARTLAHNLYEHDRVADLPREPEFIFTSTDMSKGRAFRIAPGFVGSWDYDYVEPAPRSISLGTAVAASAAFPPSLTVVDVRTKGLGFPKPAPPVLSLVDGGVYDNLGLEWFQGEGSRRPASAKEKPPFTIVANASGLFAVKNKRFWSLTSLGRDLSIQYEQSLSVRIRWWVETLQEGEPGVYVATKTDPRKEPHLDPAVVRAALPSELVLPLARLRTDLDRFSTEEADLLSYHAYWTVHARLRTYAADLALAEPAWTDYADLSAAETERLRKLLELGSHRFFRRVRAALRR
ncbi:MAG TPA: patatin-like phospholipase family protein [Thermoleophilaceae bacterium]